MAQQEEELSRMGFQSMAGPWSTLSLPSPLYLIITAPLSDQSLMPRPGHITLWDPHIIP